jgi:hypothetical protein
MESSGTNILKPQFLPLIDPNSKLGKSNFEKENS